jgi:hypothetical protein
MWEGNVGQVRCRGVDSEITTRDHGGMHDERPVTDIDTSSPSVARGYDHWLGGKDNFEVDRTILKAIEEIVPEARPLAQENRYWLIRAARFLSSPLHAGIDQFLDLGCGLPTMQNVHQVAQANNPDAVVVYVDNDPTVAAYGRAMLLGEVPRDGPHDRGHAARDGRVLLVAQQRGGPVLPRRPGRPLPRPGPHGRLVARRPLAHAEVGDHQPHLRSRGDEALTSTSGSSGPNSHLVTPPG